MKNPRRKLIYFMHKVLFILLNLFQVVFGYYIQIILSSALILALILFILLILLNDYNTNSSSIIILHKTII